MSEKNSPVLRNAIPDQLAYAGLDANPLNLNDYISNDAESDGDIVFTVTLADGKPLPTGLSVSSEGLFSGRPRFNAISGEPYSLLVVAKNAADIPLVAYFNLTITEADAAVLSAHDNNVESVVLSTEGNPAEAITELPVTEEAHLDIDAEFEAFLDSLDPSDVVSDPSLIEGALIDNDRLAAELSDPEYLAFIIRYFVRKFSSLQIYNADEVFSEFDILNTYEAGTGWKVYDSDVALTTTNPRAMSSDFCRGDFIATVREMISLAAQRGWQTVGVKGCDRELGYRLVNEFNETVDASMRLQVDNYTDFSTWHERAESEKLTRTFEMRR